MEVRSVFPGWAVGKVYGQQYSEFWTEGHFTDKGRPGPGVELLPFKELYGTSWTPPEETVATGLAIAQDIIDHGSRFIDFYFWPGEPLEAFAVYAETEAGELEMLNGRMIAYFKRKYPGCAFYLAHRDYTAPKGYESDRPPVAVGLDGQAFGVLMPATPNEKYYLPELATVPADAPVGPLLEPWPCSGCEHCDDWGC